MKVESAAADWEMMQKDTSVPRGTIETFGLESRMRLSDSQHWSIVPSASGTDRSLKTLTQSAAADTGLLSPGPCGTDFLQLPYDLCNPDRDLSN
jgi:hypothetical protein